MVIMKPAPGVEDKDVRGGEINDGDMQMYFIDMMTDDSTQDKVAVCNITQQTMRITSEKFPHLEEIDILSDGASCYKCRFTRVAAFSLHQ